MTEDELIAAMRAPGVLERLVDLANAALMEVGVKERATIVNGFDGERNILIGVSHDTLKAMALALSSILGPYTPVRCGYHGALAVKERRRTPRCLTAAEMVNGRMLCDEGAVAARKASWFRLP